MSTYPSRDGASFLLRSIRDTSNIWSAQYVFNQMYNHMISFLLPISYFVYVLSLWPSVDLKAAILPKQKVTAATTLPTHEGLNDVSAFYHVRSYTAPRAQDYQSWLHYRCVLSLSLCRMMTISRPSRCFDRHVHGGSYYSRLLFSWLPLL